MCSGCTWKSHILFIFSDSCNYISPPRALTTNRRAVWRAFSSWTAPQTPTASAAASFLLSSPLKICRLLFHPHLVHCIFITAELHGRLCSPRGARSWFIRHQGGEMCTKSNGRKENCITGKLLWLPSKLPRVRGLGTRIQLETFCKSRLSEVEYLAWSEG